ncbi:MAG: carbohydrate ABC transporter permease [Clostridiales bacterium]|nr:carbohydrate ABC transporter permease [Clostridiales bacterium]
MRNKHSRRWRGASSAFGAIKHALMAIMSAFMIGPLIWILLGSVKTEEMIRRYPPVLFPDAVTFEHYVYSFGSQSLFRFVGNSIGIAVCVTLVGVAAAAMCAYVFSRYSFRGKGFFIGVVLFPMLIPGICNLIPIYSVYARMGLINNFPALVLLYVPGMLPFSIWVLRNYFDCVPVQLEEAAMIDGCTKAQVLGHVVLPVALPGLLAVSIIGFVGAWNEFLLPLIFTSENNVRPITIGLYNLIGFKSVKYGSINAVAVTAVLPVVVLFLIFRKQFISSMIEGAIKG